MSLINRAIYAVSRNLLNKMGYAIKPKGEGYLDAQSILKAASKENIPVTEYLEKNNIGGVGRTRDDVINVLQHKNVFSDCEKILEIGAGTGMYLEKFIELCTPNTYEVYETNLGWSEYLKHRYNRLTDLKVHNADGSTLAYTNNDSVDKVTAHGVFVYLPIIITFQYLKEAFRVCKNGGQIIFDCFTDRIFTADEILRFREVNPHYDFPVVIPEKAIIDFCTRFNLVIESQTDIPYHSTYSTYYILRKM